MWRWWHCWTLLLLPTPTSAATTTGPAPGPVLAGRPFVTVWNVPSEPCARWHNVTLPLGVFDVLANAQQAFEGQDITLFYSQRLGLYPHYSPQGDPVDGGLPQNASLAAHLRQAARDVQDALPDASYGGLAVIDWESWRPLWVRDWGSMDVYRQRSEELVRQQHPEWPSSLVEKMAQQQYEEAARNFMEQTLQLGERLRPGGYWGFYGFPDCYNNDFGSPQYDGSCPAVERQRNQELGWLWNSSRALYPSIYLPTQLKGTGKVLSYVRYRVAEAFAVQDGVLAAAIPVLPYAQIAFDNTIDFLSEVGLVGTGCGAPGCSGALRHCAGRRWPMA